MRFSVSVPGTDACFFITRWASVQNFYYIGFVQNNLSVRKTVSSTQTTVTSAAFTASASTNYWLRCLQVGTSIKLKIWADGSSEPGAWNISTTDSSLAQGSPGLRLFGGASDVVLVDNYSVSVPPTSHSLPADGCGGVFN